MSSTTSPDIPWDLVTDILSRLPAKSVLRFRCVARSVCALSKDAEFISLHLRRSPKNCPQLLVHSNSTLDSGQSFSLLSLKTFDFAVDPNFPFPKSGSILVVIGSCNGIVCLLCDQGPSIILWNPLLREHQILPPPLLPYSLSLTAYQTDFNSIGFSFHNGEYKVVRLASRSTFEVDLVKIEIYSTGSSSWRELDLTVPCKIYDLSCSMIAKGTPYWIGYEGDINLKCIVSFDMADEVFRTIQLPMLTSLSTACGIGTVNEQLAVYFHLDYYDDEDDDRCIEIWVMDDQSSEERWTKLFDIRNFPVPGWPLGLYDEGLFLWRKSEGSLFSSSSSSPRDLLVYSPLITDEVKSVKCIIKDHENLKAYPHLESLVSIHGWQRS